MARKIRGPVAVIRTWGPNASTNQRRRLEVHVSDGVQIIRGRRRKLTNGYPDGAEVHFPGGRIEIICEVLPRGLGEQDARMGRWPAGSIVGTNIEIMRLPLGRRVGVRVQRVEVTQRLSMGSRVGVVGRSELDEALPPELRYIGVQNEDLEVVIGRLATLVKAIPTV